MRAVLPVVVLLLVWGALLALAVLLVPGLDAAVSGAYERTATGFSLQWAAAPGAEKILVVLGFALALFCMPVMLAAGGVVTLLGHNVNLMDPNLWGSWLVPFLVVLLWLSWVVWSFAVSRSLRLLGLWSPFLGAGRGRRWIVQRWVRFWQWVELGRFGQGPGAAWAGFVEVISNRYRDGDVFLGRVRIFRGVFGILRPIGISTEKHMVTIAETGSGKSTGALIPNLCLHKGSLLCVDPKGELATITAARRGAGAVNGVGRGVHGLGQKVFVLDPFKNVKGWPSASYNVFDEMARVAETDPDAPVSYAGKIAEALVTRMSEKEAYFDNAAQTFIRGLILFVFLCSPEEGKNLVGLRRLITEGDVEEYDRQVAAGVIDPAKMTAFDVLLEKMKTGRDFGPIGEVIAAAASSLLMMGPNQMGSVITTAQEHTAFLDAPQLQRISLRSDFLLEDLKGEPISVYLCLPLNAVSGKEGRWLRMFVLLTIDMMMRVTTAPKPPILLAVDEFPSLGHLEGIEVVAPVLRSYGVRFWAIGQNIEQFEKAYPKSWGGFIGGAEAVQFMGITHRETVKMLVEMLGQHVVRERVRQGPGPQGVRTVETIRPLLDADQVARLLAKKWQTQIIWRGSSKPMLLQVCPYFEYLPFWYYDADPRFVEKQPRRFWRRFG